MCSKEQRMFFFGDMYIYFFDIRIFIPENLLILKSVTVTFVKTRNKFTKHSKIRLICRTDKQSSHLTSKTGRILYSI